MRYVLLLLLPVLIGACTTDPVDEFLVTVTRNCVSIENTYSTELKVPRYTEEVRDSLQSRISHRHKILEEYQTTMKKLLSLEDVNTNSDLRYLGAMRSFLHAYIREVERAEDFSMWEELVVANSGGLEEYIELLVRQNQNMDGQHLMFCELMGEPLNLDDDLPPAEESKARKVLNRVKV